MEDEDGESKVMDMWNILGDQQLKDLAFGNTLKHSVDNVYIDTIEEEKRISRYNSVTAKESASRNTGTGSKIVFKGFKKRILAQAQETQSVASKCLSQEQLSHPNVSPKNNKEKRTETKRGKITEYAQYLGLQPSSKSKCSKCHSSTNLTSTNLRQSQCTCNTTMAPMQGLPSTSETSSQSHATNFKITRKVYLCAACGTYFENWNLFLHMRDIHKRHICLFCLGMFGQAERLSYHLSKKHSVPETGFDSVEDFYSAFKGSCYLVCCTCEKMFSETDNFYNHFCSPPSKQEITATICTLCRQTGSHASTCALAVESNKETNSVIPVTTTVQTGTVSSFVTEKPTNISNKGTSRKVIKNNRNKYGEDSISNSYQQHGKKINAKAIVSQCNENQLFSDTVVRDGNLQDEVTANVTRDTVSETIMEVSKYVDDSCNNEVEPKEDSISSIEKVSLEKSQIQNNQIEPYDSVTQTIMEVSRCTNDTEEDSDISKENTNQSGTTDINSSTESQTENSCKMDSIPVESIKEINHESQETNSENQPIKDTEMAKDEKSEISKEKLDSESHSSSSPAHSPVSRSLFSPQHETQQDLQPKGEYPDDGSKHVEPAPPTESQTSVSFNTVPASDRSLVIKICTNKNSQFSVSSTVVNVGNAETHNISKDSEENNNAEESTSEEKLLSLSQKDKDNTENDPVNEADSDSDSYKLAVVDSNAEEVDDVKESNHLESSAEANTSTEVKEDTSTHENKEEFAIGETTNGECSTAEQYNDAAKDAINCAQQLPLQPSDGIILAGEDVPPIDLNVEGTLDSTEIEDLLKRCIEAASPFCVYCNHARHIAVNGKQLGLHMLAEHKFHPQHPAIIIQPEQFTARVKKSLEELDSNYFNLDTYSSTNGTYNIPTVRTYECFHCRYNSAVHKELYTHHRKMHQKTILICIMCKSTFYSYSELLCHLCPGIYSPNTNVKYRCCLCSISSLPSAFRLMVHLRKTHHACDVCLETTGNQQRLSNHVWKHKLHHLCYRCGIAYRNKPDITKHLFWKHGTESVLCKKCLQKKWPHIYHFCIPPTAFVCEECGSSFSRAVALKVHKRLHSGDEPYTCSECSERFISQRLLSKHEESHKETPPVDVCTTDATNNQLSVDDEKSDKDKTITADIASSTSEGTKEVKETVKKVVDVYDLPPLNLSSDSDSETDEAKDSTKKNEETTEKSEIAERNTTEEAVGSPSATAKVGSPVQTNDNIADEEQNEEEKKQEAKIMDGIWDNFKSYTASLGMQESASSSLSNKEFEHEPEPEIDVAYLRSIVLSDHDYCVVWSEKDKNTEGETKEDEKGTDNTDYPGYANKLQRSPSTGSLAQNTGCESDVNKKKVKSPKKKKQNGSTSSSDSSSESDSSSCSCGTNCSCSSSSSGSSSSSSSSSDSDSSASESSPRKSSNRKERKKEKESVQENQSVSPENENKEAPIEVDNAVTDAPAESISVQKALLRESDLETDETETDEDFYDEHPQQLANKLLAEKRNQLLLLAAVAPASTESGIPLNNGITDESCVIPSPNPTASVEEQPQQQKRKVKTKKRKRGERGKQRAAANPMVESLKLNIPKAYYQKNSNFVGSAAAMGQHQHQHHHQLGRSSTPNLIANEHQTSMTAIESHSNTSQNIGGSGSETENKRSSKRKRIPKRFYGDSSDEETEKQPTMKWRKVVETPPSFVATTTNLKPVPQRLSFGGKTVAYRPSNVVVESHTDSHPNVAAASATESEGPADSSSESSDSDVEMSIQQQQSQVSSHVPASNNAPISERPVNLYCYCQCPYDEVSEMIACDGEDCRIEWFHFECVGIMVPPKGKWYCPDCRKKHGIVQNNEDYFD